MLKCYCMAQIAAEDGGQAKQGEESSPPYQIPVLVSLSISLVHRVLMMGEQVGYNVHVTCLCRYQEEQFHYIREDSN